MNHYIDCEFLEGPQQEYLYGFKPQNLFKTIAIIFTLIMLVLTYFIGIKALILTPVIVYLYIDSFKSYITKPTIDLISIGIVCEDGREYYAISKDFNLKEAWGRYGIIKDFGKPQGLGDKKVHWIRENVLKPIYWDMMNMGDPKEFTVKRKNEFNYKNFKRLLNKYGKTNKEIAKEIVGFCYEMDEPVYHLNNHSNSIIPNNIKFHAYYADYDWVAFCWLFGNMINLPKGFPKYCVDLKQIMDEKADKLIDTVCYNTGNHTILSYKEALKEIKNHPKYPKNNNPHHALSDAKFDRNLHNFLNRL